MKKKNYGTVLMSMLLVGAVVGWTIFNSTPDPQPAVEYRAVCRGLPTNAHWTSGGTRKEILQTETSGNVREPSPVGMYNASTSNTACNFVCDGGFEWDSNSKTCNKSSKWMCDMNAVCGESDISVGSYTIKACNLGTSIAGTGIESYGCYYQRGNNYGFASTGTLLATNTKPNASGYGSGNFYSSGTFITAGSDWSSSQNDNLRGGSGDTQANGRDSGNARIDRKGPCPDGYHVPSAGEWSGLVMTRWNTIGSGGDAIDVGSGLPYFGDTTKSTAFRNDFLLPLAGYRDYGSSATVYSRGYDSTYWSSSPNGSYARYLYLNTSHVLADNGYDRAFGFSLRCFKN